MADAKPDKRRRRRLAAAAVIAAAAGGWLWLRGDRIPVVWRVETDGAVAGWAADGESFFTYSPLFGSQRVPLKLRRHTRANGRIVAEIALPAGLTVNDEPSVLELPDGRIAVLGRNELFVGRFEDDLGGATRLPLADDALPQPYTVTARGMRSGTGNDRLIVVWTATDESAGKFVEVGVGVTQVYLPELTVESWSSDRTSRTIGATPDGSTLAVVEAVGGPNGTRFEAAAVSRSGGRTSIGSGFGNKVVWSETCAVGVGPGFDSDSREKLRFRAVPFDGSPPRVLDDGIISTQPTATIRTPSAQPESGWYFFGFADYEGARNAVFFPAQHRYLAHVSGDPLDGGHADVVLHEVEQGVSVNGLVFGTTRWIAAGHFSPDGRWLLISESDGSLELVDLRSLLP